ncbi:hypothetical protein BVY00_00730 [bacterium G20]|nr:hypothetical protein BVY00_00730 [bacterium G20]
MHLIGQTTAIFGSVLSGFGLGAAVLFGSQKRIVTAPRAVFTLLFTAFVIMGALTLKPYKTYAAKTITIHQPGATIAQVCDFWRPTWTLKDCIYQVQLRNMSIDLAHLRVGSRLFLDSDDVEAQGHDSAF